MKKKLPNNKTLLLMSRSITIVILLLSSFFATAQSGKKVRWSDMGKNRNATFYDVQNDFYKKWKGPLKEMAREKRKAARDKKAGKVVKEETEAGGFEPYKRWESFMKPRVFPSGDMTLPSTNYANFMAWKKTNIIPSAKNPPLIPPGGSGNWTSLGPVGSPSGPSPYSRTGAGRVNFLRFDPTNSNTMFIGTPDGGLWKSTNAGTTWTTNTDFLSVIGSSDLVIDPTNANNMYLATGDLEGNRNSIGVLKSTDGGATWNATGFAPSIPDGVVISRLLMNPSNPLNMLVATNSGIYRTTDGWTTFTQTQNNPLLKDMQFKPGDPNTVYAAGTTFWKSTDNGVTWAQIITGLPSANVQRIALGVSAANSGYVYALIGKASNQSFLGMYRSTNSGASFSLRSSSPNLLGYEANGSDTNAGQAFYDLSIAVSPTNAEIVTTGGVNHWQSADGGAHWTNKSLWDAGQIHADVHNIDYLPGSSTTIFSCNDGGIFKSVDNAANWTDISHNLSIAQVVGIGLSANVATTMVDGEQDNGTNLKTGSGWANIFGGDGGACFIDYTNNNTVYVQYVLGDFNRSDDGGTTFNSLTASLPGGFDFYSAWHQDPVTSTKLYVAGTATLYGSVDKGNNWSALGTPPGSGTITEFAIAPSNHAIIYAVKQDAISKSTDSGVTFTDITGTLPANAAFSNVTVSSTDPNKVWVTYSGYSATDKVYKSTNGGTTWTNISTGLPNLPMNTIVYTNGSANDAVYLGADIGVYYLNNTMSSWVPFMTSLPNTSVHDLKIFYPTGKLRAGTYGRGSWESNLYPSSLSTNALLTTIKVTPASTLATASGPGYKNYTTTVANSEASLTVTATAQDPTATITVNGMAVTSGMASGPIALNIGPNTITTVVTAQDGTTSKSYIITVTRALSTNALLSNLAISSGTLTPVFAAATTSYTADVSNATTFLTVTPTASDANATIKVNGTTVPSGTASGHIVLNVGTNVITTVVTAQDGSTTKTYTTSVLRTTAVNALLTTIKLTPSSSLAAATGPGYKNYTTSVPNTTSSLTVTATAQDPAATITVNGTAVASGTASGALPMAVGPNTITILVTSEDGTTSKSYIITATRAPSANALLATIKVTPASTLATAAGPGYKNYTTTVPNSEASLTVTATLVDPTAAIKVNGSAVASGTASGLIALNVGPNTITTVVTAQDGSTTKSYIITVTRSATPSMNSLYEPVAVVKPNDGVALNGDGIVVHQGLSPNGDGQNDVLIIEGLASYPDNNLSIINRSGKLIYYAKGYDNIYKVFDGHSNKNGRMQQAGTYFYSLDYKVGDQAKHKTGFIILKY